MSMGRLLAGASKSCVQTRGIIAQSIFLLVNLTYQGSNLHHKLVSKTNKRESRMLAWDLGAMVSISQTRMYWSLSLKANLCLLDSYLLHLKVNPLSYIPEDKRSAYGSNRHHGRFRLESNPYQES